MSYLTELGLGGEDRSVLTNAVPPILIERALSNGEGILSDTGALCVLTGKYTGRSPHDRFIVDTPAVHDRIAWGPVNMPISDENYQKIKAQAESYLASRDELYVEEVFAGADRAHGRKIRIVCELASQALFCNDLFVNPTAEEVSDFDKVDFTVLAAPGCTVDPAECGTNSEAAVLLDFDERMIVVCGTSYAGEIKKSVFTVMNYLLVVEDGVLPMHCSANMDPETHDTAVFFGLSGTGKTTLSADENRRLIGDDEHGWSDDGVFNFEGGCYAKTIRITPETEPQIYGAIRFGAMAENVVIDPVTRKPDYFDGSITENGRVGYDISYIDNSVPDGRGGIPTAVIFLTCDSFGVLPPVSKLGRNAAMYQFIAGFTSKVAGTERGIDEPQPTFSTLFGEPFMPLSPDVYAKMLGDRIDRYGTNVYLVNTGWTGGPYGVGERMKLRYTREMVTAVLNGSIEKADFRHDDTFNVDIPSEVPNVPSEILDPRSTWENKDAYDKQANKVAAMFEANCAKKYPDLDPAIRDAGPHAK
jgi:phosphoenolpyruvate carboxykinase (ATP)